MKVTYLFSLLLLLSSSAFALVDYSGAQGPQAIEKKNRSFVKRNAPQKSTTSKRNHSFSFTPTLGYETKDLGSSKVNFYNLGARMNTSFGISLNTKYWMASSDQLTFLEDTTYQAGNLTTELGFNWLNLGDTATKTTLDLSFGMTWKTNGSEFASDRSDKIFTVISSKRFYSFGLLLQYQFRMTGKSELAASIGDIHRISAVMGWVATPDISFELEGALYRIGEGEGSNKITSSVAYSYLEPRINLQLSKLIELQIGGRFRVQRASVDKKLIDAKLWDLPGVYSNSIFANINMFI